jgi:hypothetical protein
VALRQAKAVSELTCGNARLKLPARSLPGEEEDVFAFGVVPCPYGDGQCSVPDALAGQVMVAQEGVLTAVPRQTVEELASGRALGEMHWQAAVVREAMTAGAGGGDENGDVVSIVVAMDDNTRVLSGIYVKCQPCNHEWINEP